MILHGVSVEFSLLDCVHQDPLRDRFERVPYIQHNREDSWGLLGFDKKLTEEDIQFVKDNCKVEGKTINWSTPLGDFSPLSLSLPAIVLTLTPPQRMRSTNSKSTEQTSRPLELSLSRIQNPVAVGEGAGVADVADVAVVEVVVENRNERTDPPTRRLLLTKRLATRGNAALNLMAVHSP